MWSWFQNLFNHDDSLEEVVSCLDDLVLKVDEDGLIVACAAADEKTLTIPKEKIIGANYKDVYPQYYQKLYGELLNKTFASHSLQFIEYQSIMNEEKWYRARAVPLKAKRKGKRMVIVVISDITSQKVLLNNYKDALDKLRAVTDHIEDVIWMTDTVKLKMIYISPSYERVWERSIESLMENSLSFTEAIDERDRARVVDSFYKQAEGTFNEIYRINTPSGQKWIQDRAFPVKNENGEVTGVVGIASDITEQKKQEEIIAFQRAKIITSAKMSTLGEMAGGIAHEINNPLMIIHGRAAQLKKMGELGLLDLDEIKTLSTKIEVTTERIAKIVKGLKAFSRNADQDPLVKSPVGSIIDDCLELCRERFHHFGVELRVIGNRDELCLCRPTQISQVLLNLINNAFDAVNGQQGAWVELQIEKSDHKIRFMVTDSGNGIDETVENKMMEPFFTTKELGKGTGLGLSISKGIIESHHGEFWFDRDFPNTRFIFDLPL